MRSSSDPRSRIPNINQLAATICQSYQPGLPHELAVMVARQIAHRLRTQPGLVLDQKLIRQVAGPLTHPGPRQVINATGILLHTNLGRSPLSREVLEKAFLEVEAYTDLEMDLQTGKRGHRDRHFRDLARLVWDVEDATLVNNAAAAVCLCLAALCSGGETIVSRGELIEIGGSFRLPDIMAQAGTKLVEVGTTNKTRLSDYQGAIGSQSKALMKTHCSNYRIEGFTAEVSLTELARLGREAGLPTIMDLGSGLSRSLPFPQVSEPFIEDYLAAGPDILIFSGDKLFGGVQAGIVLGRHDLVQKMRQHPLMRMLRLDKLGISLISHQLSHTMRGRGNPFSQLANSSLEMLSQRSLSFCNSFPELEIEVAESSVCVGGGSLPQEQRPSLHLLIKTSDPDRLAGLMRMGEPAVIGYIRHQHYHLNLASVFPQQDQTLIRCLREALAQF